MHSSSLHRSARGEVTVLVGGRIIDASIDRVGDLVFGGGRLMPPEVVPARGATPGQTHDVTGCVVMAGGVDLHTHIGGGKVTIARQLMADQMPARPRDCEFLPAASVTADRYLDMGYTVAVEPAMIACNARAAHAEMVDVVGLDTAAYVLLGNETALLRLIAARSSQSDINRYVAAMVRATQALGVKVVNPGGIDAFKFNARAMDLDTGHPVHGVTPRQIIASLCTAVHEIGLPHPLHVHCSNLGTPGNIETTLATIDAAAGLPIHLCHVQFHAYGADGPYKMSSAAARLADAVNANPNVTVDIGQVQFGQTVTISADTMHQHENIQYANPGKSILVDIECEAGCGAVPFKYRRRQFVHSLQWSIGLELMLMIDDPSRCFLTTDHPNGGPFTAYPHILRLLGDRSFRETALDQIHADAAASGDLRGIDREVSLSDITAMTRFGPASRLGLADRGNLRPGSVADVVVYEDRGDLERTFANPKMVFKHGVLIRCDGRKVGEPPTDQTLIAGVRHDCASLPNHLAIGDQEMTEVLGCHRVSVG